MSAPTDNDAARDKVTDTRDLAFAAGNSAQAALDLMPPATGSETTPTTKPILIESADAFDRAIATAAPFAVLTLAAGFVYRAPLTIRTPVSLVSETYDARRGQRMTRDEPAPRFLESLIVTADDVMLLGLDQRQTAAQGTVLSLRGARTLVDRGRLLGDPTAGARRGINYAGEAGSVLRSYIDDVFLADRDTQAIYTQDMGPGGLLIDDCYLSAAGQGFMAGGGDPTSEARTPRGIKILRSTLTKNPAWLALKPGGTLAGGQHVQQCKTPFELKNAIDVELRDCVLEYGGVSDGQPAACIVLTPRNQGNTAPYTTVQTVRITNCVGRYAGGAVCLQGDDNNHPSQQLTDVQITNCRFESLDPATYGGAGRIFYFNRGTRQVTLEAITASGVGLKSIAYFDEKRPPVGLVLRNLHMPIGLRYAWHNVYGDTLASLKQYAPDAVLEVTPGDVGATL